MAVKAQSYLSAVRKSGLVDEESLSGLLRSIPEVAASDSQILSKHLVANRLITPWQNEKLLDGRHKGFFLGKYKLLDHLGSGGMGSVYLAVHTLMKRKVAIKVLPRNRAEEQSSYLERFHREAQAIASLDHRNIVQAFDVDNEGSTHYIALEYIDGRDLDRAVKADGPLDVREAAEYIRQTADGLDHAHSRGMVHRDIKPGNLLVDSQGVVKILDMGLARLTGLDQKQLTMDYNDGVIGTADYLAPEQALDSHNVDARADLYSLGCSLYFLLAGHAPFPTGTMAERLVKHQKDEPRPLCEIRDDVPDALESIRARLMAKKPRDRFQAAAEARDALAVFLKSQGAGSSARLPKPDVADPQRPAVETVTNMIDETVDMPKIRTAAESEPIRRPQPANSPYFWWWIGGGASTLLLLFVGMLTLGSSDPQSGRSVADQQAEKRRGFVDADVKWVPQTKATTKAPAAPPPAKAAAAPQRPPVPVSVIAKRDEMVFQQADDGLVVIEAEHFHTSAAAGDHRWEEVTEADLSGGKGMRTAERGTKYDDNFVATSPRLEFRIRFNRAGKHALWLCGKNAGASSDSCHATLNGNVIPVGTAITKFKGAPTWSRTNMDNQVAEVDIPAAGEHTVAIYMREDGLTLDKLLLTPDLGYQPADSGPPESARAK